MQKGCVTWAGPPESSRLKNGLVTTEWQMLFGQHLCGVHWGTDSETEPHPKVASGVPGGTEGRERQGELFLNGFINMC